MMELEKSEGPSFKSKLFKSLLLSDGKVEFECRVNLKEPVAFCASAPRKLPNDAPKDIESIIVCTGWHDNLEASLDNLFERLKNPQPIEEGVS